jgi:hypothetical protein
MRDVDDRCRIHPKSDRLCHRLKGTPSGQDFLAKRAELVFETVVLAQKQAGFLPGLPNGGAEVARNSGLGQAGSRGQGC